MRIVARESSTEPSRLPFLGNLGMSWMSVQARCMSLTNWIKHSVMLGYPAVLGVVWRMNISISITAGCVLNIPCRCTCQRLLQTACLCTGRCFTDIAYATKGIPATIYLSFEAYGASFTYCNCIVACDSRSAYIIHGFFFFSFSRLRPSSTLQNGRTLDRFNPESPA